MFCTKILSFNLETLSITALRHTSSKITNKSSQSRPSCHLIPAPSSRKMAGLTQTISYVTIANEEEARKLARSIVENRLAACVNIVKEVKSVYEWEGKIEEESESMLIIKSDSSKTNQLTEFVVKNHSYDCPEVVTMKIESGNKRYLDWISETVAKPPPKAIKDE